MEKKQPVGEKGKKEDTIKALIDAPILHKLESFAQRDGRKLGDVLTEAIVEYLEQHDRY
jgi:hypothetical protein